jgi:GNAT superfamily N-acetyltransferase
MSGIPDPISVRPLASEEASARIGELAAILVDAVVHGASVNFLAGCNEADAIGFWRGQLPGIAEGSRILLVAEERGAIVGTTVVTLAHQPNAPHRAELGKMLVLSAARRRRLGTRLLNAAEETARSLGRTLLLLDTQSGGAGEHLYRSCGWTQFGVVPDHALTPEGEPAPTAFFYKRLASP